MKIPTNLLIIGSANHIAYIPREKKRKNERTLNNFLIAVNRSHTALFIFPNVTTGARKSISDSHGRQKGRIHTAVSYRVPTVDLQVVGIVTSVQYSTDWWEGDTCKYEHVFDDPPALYADQYSRFRVMGIKARHGAILTEEGIQG